MLGAATSAHAAPPRASFTASPQSPLSQEEVTFTSTSSDPDGHALTYAWELDGADDDFNEASGPTARWTFRAPGRYAVRLRVSDPGGMSATASMTVAVRDRPPLAEFVFFPASPKEDETVDVVSISSDPDGQVVEQAWDLDGDGEFDDASAPTARVSFRHFTGTRSIGLRVRDNDGGTADQVRAITFTAVPEPLMSPFPVVRFVGRARRRGTVVKRLTVRAPFDARIVVLCRGRGCPARRMVRRALLGTPVRFRGLERRLPVGAVVTVFVTKRGRVGKYTSFRIRAGRRPLRTDRCALHGSTRPVECPSD